MRCENLENGRVIRSIRYNREIWQLIYFVESSISKSKYWALSVDNNRYMVNEEKWILKNCMGLLKVKTD